MSLAWVNDTDDDGLRMVFGEGEVYARPFQADIRRARNAHNVLMEPARWTLVLWVDELTQVVTKDTKKVFHTVQAAMDAAVIAAAKHAKNTDGASTDSVFSTTDAAAEPVEDHLARLDKEDARCGDSP